MNDRFPARFVLLLSWATAGAFGAAPTSLDIPSDRVVQMLPFNVKERPATSFGLSLRIFGDPQTRLVKKILILTVAEDSEAEYKGLERGTEILSVDGKSVNSFPFGLNQGTELNRLFVNRKYGETITLVVFSKADPKPRTLTLHEGLVLRYGLPGFFPQ